MSNFYITTHIEITDPQGECFEVEIEANYDYQPEEPMVRYYPDGSGYPGCPAAVEGIYDIKCISKYPEYVELFDIWIAYADNLEYAEEVIENAIWEYIEENGEPC